MGKLLGERGVPSACDNLYGVVFVANGGGAMLQMVQRRTDFAALENKDDVSTKILGVYHAEGGRRVVTLFKRRTLGTYQELGGTYR